jgi:hypothetical protein
LSDTILVWENTTTYALHVGFPEKAVFCIQMPGEPDTWNFPYTIHSSGSRLVREVNLYVISGTALRVGTATQGDIELGSPPTPAPISHTSKVMPAPGYITKSTGVVSYGDDNLLDSRESPEPVEALIPGVLIRKAYP